MVALKLFGSSVWDFLHVTFLAPKRFEIAPRLLENFCAPAFNAILSVLFNYDFNC
jgi:hypothetical protein